MGLNCFVKLGALFMDRNYHSSFFCPRIITQDWLMLKTSNGMAFISLMPVFI